MKFGIIFANTGSASEPATAVVLARQAERLGFESLWASHHAVIPAGYSSPCPYTANGQMPGGDDLAIPDPLVWLGYIAAVTDRIRLATGAIIAPLMNPILLAKQVATLDRLSGGRVDVGVGIGWLREEFEALAVPFDRRGARTDEYIAAMRELWTQPTASYHGEYVNFDECILRPRPVQNPVPVHVGGDSVVAAQRAGRYGDGFLPMTRDIGLLKSLLITMGDAAALMDRDENDIEVTVTSTLVGKSALPALAELQDLGVDRVLVPAALFYPDMESGLQKYRDDIIAQLDGQ